MKIIRPIALMLLISGAAFASSHREAPAIAFDPAADNTDVYAFMTTSSGGTPNDTVNIVANWIPFEEPSSGPNFFKWSDDVQYTIHVARGGTSLDDVATYVFRFKTQPINRVDPATNGTCVFDSAKPAGGCVGGGKEFFAQLTGPANDLTGGGYILQTYSVTQTLNGTTTTLAPAATGNTYPAFVSAPWRIGPRTQSTLGTLFPKLVISKVYDDAYANSFVETVGTGAGAMKFFAGPRDDGFYVDLGGVFDLAHLRAKGVAQDGLAGYNVHSIAMQIPAKMLTSDGAAPKTTATTANVDNTLGVWASSSRRKISIARAGGQTTSYGPWTQVSRLGIPLVNEAVIGLQDKDKYNRTYPKNDVANFGAYFLNPTIVHDAEAVGIYGAGTPTAAPPGTTSGRLDIIAAINLYLVGAPGQTGCTAAAPCHNIPLSATGDVLRLDMNLPTAFPNGRSLVGGKIATGNVGQAEQVDVTDALLSILLFKYPDGLKGGSSPNGFMVSDGVDYNDKVFLTDIPWLALPWDGFAEGHGKVTAAALQ